MPDDVRRQHHEAEGRDRGDRGEASRRRIPPRGRSAKAATGAAVVLPASRQRRREGIADDAGRAVGGERDANRSSRRRRRTRNRAGGAAASPSGSSSPENPLTARVMVNRIWQHHFGEGIVRTPSNFGKMGERPSHPELLDWLAVEFVERGWSLKAMHRLMLTSEAYQMASDDIAANVAIDPENRLFWRMPRQRLEAEIIRDEILAVAGTLDRTLGGPDVFPYIDPDLFEASSKRNWPGKPDDDPSTWRRSLYVFSKRSIRYPMFEAFDQPNLVNSMRSPQPLDRRAAGAAADEQRLRAGAGEEVRRAAAARGGRRCRRAGRPGVSPRAGAAARRAPSARSRSRSCAQRRTGSPSSATRCST